MSDVKQTKSLDERDIELHSAFIRAYVEDVSILEDIPNGSSLILLPDDDPELAEFNLQGALEAARRGKDVYIRHFPRTKPAPGSLKDVQDERRETIKARQTT